MRASPRVVRMLAILGIVTAAVAVLVLAWRSGSSSRALRQLPPAERQVLFSQEMVSFRSLCGAEPRRDALERECREKALFLLEFPECDESCQSLSRSHLVLEGPR